MISLLSAPFRTRQAGRLAVLALLACAPLLSSGASAAPRNEPKEADRIVAVVNDEVITASDLRQRLDLALAQLKSRGTTLPPREELERQMLERLVMDRVQLQLAKDSGVRVSDADLDQAIGRIAANNKVSVQDFRAMLEKDGVPYPRFREEIRGEITISRLREREVDNRITISDGEVDNFLAGEQQGGPASGEEWQVAHILVRSPEGASPEALQKLQAKAAQAAERAAKGDDFAQLAASYSDAPDALTGGDLGFRTPDRLPAIFAQAAAQLSPGQASGVLRSPAGFHVIKLIAKKGGGVQLPPVEQTRVRHILIRVNEVVSEDEARRKLAAVKERLEKGGATFAEMARLYSQDGSAAKGGDLGWIYPGDTVPEFEKAMNELPPSKISDPVRSPFGWHLIQVQERRVQDVSDERRRAIARQTLRERRVDDAYQDWLRQIRDRAYVEIRLGSGD